MSVLSAPACPRHYEHRRLRALEHLERQASSESAFKHIGHALEPSCLCACVPVRLPARARVHPSSQCISHRGAQPGRAKRGPAARSAAPREARPPPKAAGAGGAPELREGFKRKLEATKQGAIELLRQNADSSFPGSSAPPAMFHGLGTFDEAN